MRSGFAGRCVANNLAFVAGFQGKIYVVDLTARKVVHTLAAETHNNIASLAVADGWLYVAEGSRYGSQPGRLTRIYIVPNDPRFLDLKQGQQIALPSAGHGFWDLAVSGGRYLAVTAPAQSIRYGGAHLGTDALGKVYVWTEEAQTHLDGIYRYIERDAPFYAKQMVDKLTRRSEQLIHHPYSGRIVSKIR